MDHQIIKTDSGYTCTICTWHWKSKPSGSCPGVIRYAWGKAPEHLLTKGQLEKLKMKCGEPRGVVQGTNGEYYLYDRSEAIPFTVEDIAVEKEIRRVYRLKLKTRHERARIREELLRAEFENMLTRARDGAIAWARELLANPDTWVILDTETTGLDSGDEIIQIAIVNPDGEVLLDELVKPYVEITAEAEAVNHISAAMLADKPDFAAIALQVFEILGNKKIIAYNADFDCRMLYQTCSRHNTGRDVFALDWHDAMTAYSRYYGEWSDYWHDFKWQALWGGDHTAAGDCRATLELIEKMAAAKLSNESIVL